MSTVAYDAWHAAALDYIKFVSITIPMLYAIFVCNDRHEGVSTTCRYSCLFQDGYDPGLSSVSYSQMHKLNNFCPFQAIPTLDSFESILLLVV